MRAELCEYFEQVLGVKQVILPSADPAFQAQLVGSTAPEAGPENEVNSVPSALETVPNDPAISAGDLLPSSPAVQSDRQPRERVLFIELTDSPSSFFSAESEELFFKMAQAMKLDRDQISRVQTARLDPKSLDAKELFVFMGWPDQNAFESSTVDHYRGQWLGQGLITYHPGFLASNAEAKKQAWADLQRVMKEL